MKTFLTFLGLLVVCLSLLCFTSDMDRYAKLQLHMKALDEIVYKTGVVGKADLGFCSVSSHSCALLQERITL